MSEAKTLLVTMEDAGTGEDVGNSPVNETLVAVTLSSQLSPPECRKHPVGSLGPSSLPFLGRLTWLSGNSSMKENSANSE